METSREINLLRHYFFQSNERDVVVWHKQIQTICPPKYETLNNIEFKVALKVIKSKVYIMLKNNF